MQELMLNYLKILKTYLGIRQGLYSAFQANSLRVGFKESWMVTEFHHTQIKILILKVLIRYNRTLEQFAEQSQMKFQELHGFMQGELTLKPKEYVYLHKHCYSKYGVRMNDGYRTDGFNNVFLQYVIYYAKNYGIVLEKAA